MIGIRKNKRKEFIIVKKLMHKLVCSDIRINELKLKRIRLCKKRLFETKPSRLRSKKLKDWQSNLEMLKKQEDAIFQELQADYTDLENFL